ncbi:MAG: STAS domain-containing protein [Candidatus Margulisiibacteriota bacterium]|jgi:anti-anti-sigma factor
MVFDFSLKHTEDNNVPLIAIKGEIDIYTCQKLNTLLTDVIDEGKKKIVLNFTDVLYMDSTGLGTVVKAANNLAEKEGKLYIIGVKPTIRKIFEVSGINKKDYIVFEEEQRALK